MKVHSTLPSPAPPAPHLPHLQELGRRALPFERVSRQLQRTFAATFGYQEVCELAPEELRARLAEAE